MNTKLSLSLFSGLLFSLMTLQVSGQNKFLPLDAQINMGEEQDQAQNRLAAFSSVRIGEKRNADDYLSNRTVGTIQGRYSYSLVMEDIVPEEKRQLYTWSIPLADYVDIKSMDWLQGPSAVKADMILFDTRDVITRESGKKELKPDAELLLVRVLECPILPGEKYTERLHKPVTPGAIETWPASNETGRIRRLVIPCVSDNPSLKLMFFSFRQGEQLPETFWFRNGGKLVVEWHDQRDVFLFDKGEDGVTKFVLERVKGSEGLDPSFAFGLPVPEGGDTKGNLVGHWSFDNVENGLAKDLSGNGNDATVQGHASIQGVQGQALRMDGSGSVTINPLMTHLMVHGGTVTFWWRPEGPHIQNAKMFSTGLHLSHGFDINQYAGGIRFSGVNNYNVGFTGRTMSHKWRQLAVSFDNATGIAAFYVNGKLSSEVEMGRKIYMSANERLDVLLGYKGDFDELRVYDYALSETEIADLYAEEKRYEIGHWSFDDLAKGQEVSSASGYTGFADKVTLVAGVKGEALSFDKGGTVTLPSGVVTENFNGDITVSLWFKVDHATIVGNGRLFDFNEHLANGLQCGFYGRGIRFSGAGIYNLGFSRDVKAGKWNHLVCMFDGLTAKMFLNGRQVSEEKSFARVSLNRKITLGDSRGQFNGQIDEVRMYSYPLSPEQVRKLYEMEKP